ncbi:3'-5' exonuclease [Neisseriaceae bacterium JH1-16]|nr:3'-5' exonuclease [Neisseriaceae bacterium JH1-16]
MWHTLQKRLAERRLTDPHYHFLFDEQPDELVSLDCETSSLKVRDAELLSIAAVRIRGNEVLASESFYVRVKPTRQPADEGESPEVAPDAPAQLEPVEAVKQLLDFIGGRALVGYYLEFDVAVLNRIVKPLIGVALPNRQIEVSGRYYDYKLNQSPGSTVDLRLKTLLSDLQIPATRPKHDALNDAVTAGMIYLALKERGFG